MKHVQIPEELFIKLVMYFLLDHEDLHTEIKKAVGEKYDKIINHNLYTEYKTAPTEEQKEKARQKYLDRAGIHKDFRWEKGGSPYA